MANLTERMIRAAKLETSLYEEVEADTGAMSQAMTVVILSSLAAGIGTIFMGGIGGLIMGTIGALVSWFIWSYIILLIGTKLLPEAQTNTNYGELLRTIGFSSSPGIARVLAIIPGLRGIIFFITGIWMLVAMVIAVRQALDYSSTSRAVVVCLIGWVISMVIFYLIFSIFGASPRMM